MKIKHIKQLNTLNHHAKEYGYIALKDYKQHHHLSSLKKIIKLKNKNRILCARRKSLIKELSYDQFIDTLLLTKALYCLSSLSEQVGKNSHKIRKLRAGYCKYSQKWIDSKSTTQIPKDIPY